MQTTQNLKKPENSGLEATGTGFGNQRAVQFKITHKDLILMAGVLVAMIIAITTWMLYNPSQSESLQLLPKPKFSSGVPAKIGKVLLHKF